ncbi:MAG: hypothetical protein CM15mV4_2660 [Caudoviricetes sp.]|nr:MAG: hypothetical protein CM15mV4_2660 [Caudoviricetes sp.]
MITSDELVLPFVQEDNGLVSAAATTNEDDGSINLPTTAGEEDNGSILNTVITPAQGTIQPVVQHMLLDFLFGLVLVLYSLLVEQRKLLRKQMILLDSIQSVVLQPYSDLVHTMDLEHSMHSVVLRNLELGYTTEIFLIHSHLRIMEVSMLTLHLTKIKVR